MPQEAKGGSQCQPESRKNLGIASVVLGLVAWIGTGAIAKFA
jgi:hypothetical protein